ncbi:MAG: 50S ribosomal protein L10 [Xanthomonadales bacterium]|nr:50S ribosomal protein L10 [Xanthomonadales bacterium]
MSLNLEQKKALVAELAEVARRAQSLVAAEYAGLTVEKMTELRRKARESGVYVKVAKNTLMRRAVQGTDYACASDQFSGPLLFAFSKDDPGAAARLIRDLVKASQEVVKPRFVALGGRVYPGTELERVASLPTREQALAMLLGLLKAPIVRLARTLAEPAARLARATAAVRDRKAA